MPDQTAARFFSRRWLVAIAVMSSAVMEVLDTSVVNVSLPHISGSLSSTVEESTWVLTSYIVANAIILPITGWLSNYFGRKRLLLTVVTGFTLSSVLCGLAPSLPLLIFFRVIQGITGGGLQPLSQSVMLEEFPGEERGKAMAFWSLGIIAAPVLGPTVGGWITDNYSWRWVFYINLPIGIVSLILIYLLWLTLRISSAEPCASMHGAWECWPSAWAPCRSCWTKGRKTIGSALASSRRWPLSRLCC